MYSSITSISDAELLARRLELDRITSANQAELHLLNRENDHRERVRHEAAQMAVTALEGKPAWEQTSTTTDAPTGVACAVPDPAVVVAAGDGVVVEAA